MELLSFQIFLPNCAVVKSGAIEFLTKPLRHQELLDAIQAGIERDRARRHWSYDLLSDVEQAVLRRLSIFAGDFTLQSAAAAISDDTLSSSRIINYIADLVDKSLVASEIGHADQRLHLLATTRAYARAKLAECRP